jgi:phosphopantetheine adenylyltransferase
MNTTNYQPSADPLTFEKVWAMFQESDRKYREEMKESREDFDRRMKELDRKLGRLSNRLGEMIEHLMTPDIHLAFNKLGYRFTSLSRNKQIENLDGSFFTEVDVLVENGDYVLAVEAKVKPNEQDIEDHRERMAKLRQYADAHNDKRKYIGAIAAPVFDENVHHKTVKAGFFVIEESEEAIKICNDSSFKPKEW